MSWIIEIKNIKATKEFLDNCDDEFLPMIEGDGASEQLMIDVVNMLDKKKLFEADVNRKFINLISLKKDLKEALIETQKERQLTSDEVDMLMKLCIDEDVKLQSSVK